MSATRPRFYVIHRGRGFVGFCTLPEGCHEAINYIAKRFHVRLVYMGSFFASSDERQYEVRKA